MRLRGLNLVQRREVKIQFVCLLPWPYKAADSAGMTAEVGGWDTGMSRRKEGWRKRPVWSTGDGGWVEKAAAHGLLQAGHETREWTWRGGVSPLMSLAEEAGGFPGLLVPGWGHRFQPQRGTGSWGRPSTWSTRHGCQREREAAAGVLLQLQGEDSGFGFRREKEMKIS